LTPLAAASSSKLVCGQEASSTTIVQVCPEPTMSHRQPHPVAVEEVLAEGGSGPMKPAGIAAGLQNELEIETAPVPGSTVGAPSLQMSRR
jgi:hypothetical protein